MDWERMLLGAAAALPRTLIVGVLAYAALVVLLRISGKRTLSKFSAFDFVVTVALGSTLATILVSSDVALAQGVTALVVLIGLQLAISWLSVRSERVRGIVKGEPVLLLHRGELLDGALRRERIAHEEVRAAVRGQGIATLTDVEAAVLETDGSITIVRRTDGGPPSALADVHGYPSEPGPPGKPL